MGIPISPPTIEVITMTAIWFMLPADLEIMKRTILIRMRPADTTTDPRNIMK